MEYHKPPIGRQRPPPHQQTSADSRDSTMGDVGQEDLATLPPSRFSGFKPGKSNERPLEDPFARQTVEPVARESRTPSPLRGSITPTGYQRRTNLSSGRPNGGSHVAFMASRSNTPTAAPKSGSPATPGGGRSAISPPSKARLSSVRDRVAMFERPSEETSRIPYRPTSRNSPATSSIPQATLKKESAVSKVLQPQVSQSPVGQRNTLTKPNRSSPKKPRNHESPASRNGTTDAVAANPRLSKSMHNLANAPPTASPKRPLFGETDAADSGPGFGIPGSRRRGSEGSPMHTPNAMFDDDHGLQTDTSRSRSRIPSISTSRQNSRPGNHRRAQSENSPQAQEVERFDVPVPKPWMSTEQVMQRQDANGSAKKPGSKIPIRSRASSRASDYSATSAPSPTSVTSPKGPYPRRPSTPQRGYAANESSSLSSPVRGTVSPRHSRPGMGAQLSASIIAPPPKVSPPLRSSKPRQSVSVATTAASRAKAIEKSTPSQSQEGSPQSSKSRTKLTKRLPGLENVDLEARRRQIISKAALEKAKQEELALERLRIAKEREEEFLRQEKLKAERAEAFSTASSTIEDDVTSGDDADHEEFETPMEELEVRMEEPTLKLDTSNLTPDQSYRHPVYRISTPSNIDSPTLGDVSRTSVLRTGSTLAPPAAQATVKSTDGTPIDTEPQIDLPRPEKPERTVLSQVMQMRAPSYLSSRTESRRFDDDSQSDKESIQIMLRDTAIFPESARMETLAEHNGQPVNVDQTPSTDSWTSSVEDPSPTNLAQEGNAGLRRPLQGLAALSNAVASASDSPSPGLDRGFSTSSVRSRRTELPRAWLSQNLPDDRYRNTAQDSDSASTVPPSRDEWDSRRTSEYSREAPNEYQSADVRVNEGDQGIARGLEQSYSDFLSSSCSSSSSEEEFEPPQQPQTPDEESLRPQYRASLTRREDFESASPSFIHWSRFNPQENSADTSEDDNVATKPSPPPKDEEELSDRATTPRATAASPLPSIDSLAQGLGVHFLQTQPPETSHPSSHPSDLYTPPIPTHSPPPPPTVGRYLSTGQAATSPYPHGSTADKGNISRPVRSSFSIDSVPESYYTAASTLGTGPEVTIVEEDHPNTAGPGFVATRPSTGSPHRTLVNDDRPSSGSRPSTLVNDGRLSTEAASGKTSPSPEQKRLGRRMNIIKELIDTEYSYSCDMSVVVDIYKATAIEAGMLSPDASTVLFGNCEAVLIFSQEFLSELKIAARPVYKLNKRKNRKGGDRSSKVTHSTTLVSDGSSSQSAASSDPVRDSKTTIGEVFIAHLQKMEEVYAIYVKHHDISIKKLQSLQKNTLTRGWLQECARESSDLTTAWDLGSLLVKPVQRFLKYPLLLAELVNVTNADHPDRGHLEQALNGARELSLSINETKRQAEVAKEAAKAKKNKKENVGSLIAKAISRRTEKLRQQVGLSEFVEDPAYDLMKIEFMENKTKIALVRRDFTKHLAAVQSAFTLFDEFFAAIDAWMNAGSEYRDNSTTRSEWVAARQLLKDIQEGGLSIYVNKMTHQVMAPLDKLMKASKRLETGLMAQRDSRKFDYGKYKSALNRGGKIDKKTQALGEEWNTLNKESKERMAKLLTASDKLVTLVLASFIRCNRDWWRSWGDRFRFDAWENPVIVEQKPFQTWAERLVRETVDEFKILEAETLRLGICNGSFLADTANLMVFPDESPGLGGNDSSSMSESISKRLSERPIQKAIRHLSNTPTDSDNLQRLRASSTASVEASGSGSNLRTASFEAGALGRRPATSDTSSPRFPQLHVDTPSPSLQMEFQVDGASSPNRSAPRSPGDRFSGIFSSAMPMTDSPGVVTPNPAGDEAATAAEPRVLFLAASVYAFNIDRSRREAGYPYLTYTSGEIFDVIGEKGELWLAKNQDDPSGLIGWIWNKHFVKLSA